MGSPSIAWDQANEDLNQWTQNATRRGVIQRIWSGSGLGHEYTKQFQLSQYIILHLVVELFKEETSDFRAARTTVRTVHRRAFLSLRAFLHSTIPSGSARPTGNSWMVSERFQILLAIYQGTCRYAFLFAFWWMKDTVERNVQNPR